jgi:hypothetical protein
MNFFILPQFRSKNFSLPLFRSKILFYHNSAAKVNIAYNSSPSSVQTAEQKPHVQALALIGLENVNVNSEQFWQELRLHFCKYLAMTS